jgi:transposase
MSKYFRPWKIDQPQLLPPSVQDFVPRDHRSRFIVEMVRESLDLTEITGSYTSGLGQPPFDPRLMVALLLNGYASGIYSSRRIARACVERADFMMIAALDAPDFRTISEFRKRHLKQLAGLFVQVLKLAEKAGPGAARACRARRHQDQGECLQTHGDELRAYEEAPSRAAGRGRSLAGRR